MPDFVFTTIVGLIGAILGAIIQGVLPNSSKKVRDVLLTASIFAAIALIIALLLTSILTVSTNSSATGQSNRSFDLGLIFNCLCISGLIFFLLIAISGTIKGFTNPPSNTISDWNNAYDIAKENFRKMREIPHTYTLSITDNGVESNGVRIVTFNVEKFELISSPSLLKNWVDRDRHEGIFKVKIDRQGNILNYEPN